MFKVPFEPKLYMYILALRIPLSSEELDEFFSLVFFGTLETAEKGSSGLANTCAQSQLHLPPGQFIIELSKSGWCLWVDAVFVNIFGLRYGFPNLEGM